MTQTAEEKARMEWENARIEAAMARGEICSCCARTVCAYEDMPAQWWVGENDWADTTFPNEY